MSPGVRQQPLALPIAVSPLTRRGRREEKEVGKIGYCVSEPAWEHSFLPLEQNRDVWFCWTWAGECS